MRKAAEMEKGFDMWYGISTQSIENAWPYLSNGAGNTHVCIEKSKCAHNLVCTNCPDKKQC